MKITKLEEDFYFSSIITPKDFPLLKKMGITAIVNVAPKRDYTSKAKGRFEYLYQPFNDSRLLSMSTLSTIYEFISEQREQGKVVVHCEEGISRSAGIAVGQVMLDHPDWNWRKSLKFVRESKEIFVSFMVKISVLWYVHSVRKE